MSSNEAAGKSKPEAYPQGYVENCDEARTKLEAFFRRLRQAAQTDYPARPQPKNRPQAYPQGYVEDLFKARTKLGVCFSSRR